MTDGDDALRCATRGARRRILVGEGVLPARGPSGAASCVSGRTVFVVSSPTVLRSARRGARAARRGCGEFARPRGPGRRGGEDARRRRAALGGASRAPAASATASSWLSAAAASATSPASSPRPSCAASAFVQLPTTLAGAGRCRDRRQDRRSTSPRARTWSGAFHHPRLVVSDTRLLATLPAAELRSGLVEAIKMAALLDLDLLARIERDLERLLRRRSGGAGAGRARTPRRPRSESSSAIPTSAASVSCSTTAIPSAMRSRRLPATAGLRHGEAVGLGDALLRTAWRARRGADDAFLLSGRAICSTGSSCRCPRRSSRGRLLELMSARQEGRRRGPHLGRCRLRPGAESVSRESPWRLSRTSSTDSCATSRRVGRPYNRPVRLGFRRVAGGPQAHASRCAPSRAGPAASSSGT